MKHTLPPFLIINGEVMLLSKDDPEVLLWECPRCGYIKLSRHNLS